MKRNIHVRIPHFLSAANVVACYDMIITLPYRLGIHLSQQKRHTMQEAPLKLPGILIYLYWHLGNQNNPLNQWLRKIIRAVVK